MDQTTLDLRTFTESFFTTLKAQLDWQGKVLQVHSVPTEFETFIGKKAPYTIVFDTTSPGELVARGSSLLKSMTSYLESKGQTALIKLVFEHDYLVALKRYFSFKGCELTSISKQARFTPIYQFSFATTLQYLNEKEQLLNTIHIENGTLIPFNIGEYTYTAGNAQECNAQDVKSSYQTAKQAVRDRSMPRLEELSALLSEKLSRETERIEQHYGQRRKERADTRTRLQEQLTQLEKTPPTPITAQKKERILESLKNMNAENIDAMIAQEQTFFLKDESFKHSLTVDTKLVSTTVIYYPIHILTLTIKNNDVTRAVTLEYNPLKNCFLTPLGCENCKHELREILLCSSSHILCSTCFGTCRSCERGICSLCTKKACLACARTLCKRCVTRCSVCWKDACTQHIHTNYSTGSLGCTLCLKQCTQCKHYGDKEHVQFVQGSYICTKCRRLEDFNRIRI